MRYPNAIRRMLLRQATAALHELLKDDELLATSHEQITDAQLQLLEMIERFQGE